MKISFCTLLLAGLAFPASVLAAGGETPAHFDEAAWQAEWNAGDTDGDGKLSLDEVRAANPRTVEIFDTIDSDGDGLISPEEDKAALFKALERRSAKTD